MILTAMHLVAPWAALGGALWVVASLAPQARQRVLHAAALTALAGWPMMALAALLLPLLSPLVWPPLPDEARYVAEAQRVADAWLLGQFPDLTARTHLGSLHTGYQRVGAVVAMLGLGGQRWPLVLLNALLLPVAGALAMTLAEVLREEHDAPLEAAAPPPPQFGAAALLACYPGLACHASFALREILHLIAMLALLVLAIRGLHPRHASPRQSASALALAALAAWWLFSLRSYTCLLALLALGLWWLVTVRRQRLMPWLGAAFMAALLLAFHPTSGRILAQMADTLSSVTLGELGSPGAVLWRVATGVPRLLWAPYPWAATATPPDPTLLSVPAAAWQALFIWPTVLLAWCHRPAARRGRAQLINLLMAFHAVSLLLTFAGDAPRHMLLTATLAAVLALGSQPAAQTGSLLCMVAPPPTAPRRTLPPALHAYFATLVAFMLVHTSLHALGMR
jgi:hypothetical protein